MTLTGPSGSGKTRLALAVAPSVASSFALGGCLVELADVPSPSLVLPTIGHTLGIREGTALAEALGDRELLLVLDNVEHVIEVGPQLANLLMVCPGLTVLATSRASVRLRWEYEVPVPPLEVIDAVALFNARAQTARADADTQRAVSAICTRLDGLPLAIELAAARVKLLPPQALLTRLERDFDLLAQAGHDVPDRQRTLRATLDWSYELLNSDDRASLRALAVFQGGLSIDAAQAVLALDEEHVLDRLASLVDKNLIRASEGDATPRFGMLETIRAYGLDLLASSEELETVSQRHADFFVGLAERVAPALSGPHPMDVLNRLEAELANLRAALEWLHRHGPAAESLRLAGALWRFWEVRGYLIEGHAWLMRALAADDGSDPAARARALFGAGTLASRQGAYAPSAGLFDQALRLFRQLEDSPGIALTLQALGAQAQMQGDYERAAPLPEECVALARDLGDPRLLAVGLYNLATAARENGNRARAGGLYDQALGLFRALGDKRWIGFTLSDLGELARVDGDLNRALGLGQEGLAVLDGVGEKLGIAVGMERLAWVCVAQQRPAEIAV